MSISTLDGFIGSAKQPIALTKTASRTAVAANWFSTFDLAGNPGAGTLAGSSSAAGDKPDDSTAGCPVINAFGGSATGYLAQVEFGNTVACRMKLFDMLFKCGTYAYNATTAVTLSSQPSYSSRVPGGTDYTDTQIWVEVSTAFATGTAWQVTVTYTNQSGTAARSTVISAAQAAAALTKGKMFQLALQAGDTGVQIIESVTATNGGTAMTAGAVNVLVLRPLWSGRVKVANDGDTHDLGKTGMPVVYADSAIVLAICPDSTATGIPDIELVVANG